MVLVPRNKNVQTIEAVINRTLAMETTTNAEREALLELKAQIEFEKQRYPYIAWLKEQQR